MPTELIFITGVTGFVGSAVALEALNAGYNLRICLRRPSRKVENLLSEYHHQIEYVIVPDFTEDSAFRGKLDDAAYILHVASPVPSSVDKQTYLNPAVKGTMAILREATMVKTIKKIVITSSDAALFPIDGPPGGALIKEDTNWDLSFDENADITDPSDRFGTSFRLYHASKILANKATWDFRHTYKPHYALVTMHPTMVYGHNHMQTSVEEINSSSNGVLWRSIMTGVPEWHLCGVHIEDVAEAHIKALDSKILDGSSFLLAGRESTWSEVARIVQKDYPGSGAGIVPHVGGEAQPIDSSKAERELGMSWRTWEQMVHEVMDQQLGLIEMKKLSNCSK